MYMSDKIHNSWKRLEILSIIYKLSVDIKAFCYLNKYDLVEKLSKFIITNDFEFLKFLFHPKPVRILSYKMRTYIYSRLLQTAMLQLDTNQLHPDMNSNLAPVRKCILHYLDISCL